MDTLVNLKNIYNCYVAIRTTAVLLQEDVHSTPSHHWGGHLCILEICALYKVDQCPIVPLVMTSGNLSRVLQLALSDTIGRVRGVTFKLQEGLDTPEAIGVISSSSSQGRPSPVFSGEVVGPDLLVLPVREHHIWVSVHSVFSKLPLLQQAKTSELMAI